MRFNKLNLDLIFEIIYTIKSNKYSLNYLLF
jgi:hypothetical protein